MLVFCPILSHDLCAIFVNLCVDEDLRKTKQHKQQQQQQANSLCLLGAITLAHPLILSGRLALREHAEHKPGELLMADEKMLLLVPG